MTPPTWKLIIPPDNWRNPFMIGPWDVGLLRHVAEYSGMVIHVREDQGKVYMGPRSPGGEGTSGYAEYVSASLPIHPEFADGGSPYSYSGPWRRGVLIRVTPSVRRVRLSPHFKLSEFLCRSKEYQDFVRIHTDLPPLLEEIRSNANNMFGAAGRLGLTITSAYRPRPYNRAIGGAENSTHIAGLAADIYPSLHGMSLNRSIIIKFGEMCDRVVGRRGGVGIYPDHLFVHVDVRGEEARWEG